MRLLNRWFLWIFSLLWLTATGSATEQLTPAFWKATDENRTVYLLGSIHLGAQSFYPLPSQIEHAFRSSDALFVEIDIVKEAPKLLLTMMYQGALPQNKTIWQVIQPKTAKLLKERLASLGIPVSTVEKIKPWMVSLNLGQLAMQADKLGLSEKFGVDRYFIEEAYKQKIPVYPLEHPDEQIAVFDKLSWDEQDKLLHETLEYFDGGAETFRDLYLAWRSGDTQQLNTIFTEQTKNPDTQRFYQNLTSERDNKMAERLIAYLRSHPGQYFVVVGAAHLVSDTSILRHLQSVGYRVTRIPLSTGAPHAHPSSFNERSMISPTSRD